MKVKFYLRVFINFSPHFLYFTILVKFGKKDLNIILLNTYQLPANPLRTGHKILMTLNKIAFTRVPLNHAMFRK